MRRMRFILIATSVIGLLHAYIGMRLLSPLDWPRLAVWLCWVVLALSALLQPLAFMARAGLHHVWRDVLSWVAMTVMGVFSTMLVLTLLRDVLLLGVSGLQTMYLISVDKHALEQQSAMLVLLATLTISILGFISARRTARVVHISVPLETLPTALHGFKIVQLTDIHVGPTIKQGYLSRIVHQVNALEADLIAITGDLVDGRVHDLAPHTAPLANLQSRYGSFFVTGNHEYYSGALPWIQELERLGVKVLLNEHVVITHQLAPLVVAGVTDYTAGRFYDDHQSDPLAAVRGAPAEAPKILLAHQPRSAHAAQAAGFDLQLSGHTHGGQFWPWQYAVPLQQPFVAGLHRLHTLWVYVSRGTGYWGPPNRFGSPSEITCLTLTTA